jgi:hypothetical protein
MARNREDLNQQKEQTIKRLFEDDWLLVHVDTRAKGVMVPEHLRNLSSITFKLSKLFQGTTEIKSDQVTAQLLFGSTRQECVFPYDAVWGATSVKGSNIVWPENAPDEILAQLEKGTLNQEPRADDGKEPPPSEPPKTKGGGAKVVQRGHLRRIK